MFSDFLEVPGEWVTQLKLTLERDPPILGAVTLGGQSAPGSGTLILSGTATPTADTGAVGNYYLDTDNHILYGPKASAPATIWPVALTGA